MREQIEVLGPATLTRFAETTHAALGEMRGTTSPRLLLEVLCARLLLPATSADGSALLQQIEQLEAGGHRWCRTHPNTHDTAAAPAESVSQQPVAESRFMRPSERRRWRNARLPRRRIVGKPKRSKPIT